ncbi:MAG: Trigger factor [Parcubacteria group bacterium GW2011_GWE2_37_8]|nr:MAG: Trigger factor [Parcubacteria group bacterium GW2011_GWE2_37_8]KKQ59556.1 MAG: Trigger factor [Parcubacteria group bacterium GW2011_GWD1_38_16]
MDFKLEKLPKSKINLIITLDAGDLKKYADQAVLNFSEHAKIKGFRAGKAPKHFVVEHIGQNRINDETVNVAIEDSYSKILLENDIEVISRPKIEVVKFIPNKELEYKAEILVSPEIKLADYREIAKKSGQTEKQEVKVDKKEVKDALNWILNSRAKYIKIDRPSQKGDLAVVSYELRNNGVKIEGADQKQHPIILGEGKLAPGFEDQLIGLKTGEEKEFSLDIPQDFINHQIAGKKIDFKVNIDDLMQKDLPKLDDEFAKSIGHFENLELLEKSIEEGILNEKNQAEKDKFRIALILKVASQSEMDISEELIESELEKMIYELEHDIKHRGMEFDKYLEHIKKTRDDLKKEFRDKAIERVRIALVMREIGKSENIEISDEELAEKMKEVLTKLGDQTQNIDHDRLHGYTENIIMNEKVFELLEKLAK